MQAILNLGRAKIECARNPMDMRPNADGLILVKNPYETSGAETVLVYEVGCTCADDSSLKFVEVSVCCVMV